MPIRLQAPVLQVDANVIHQVDTSNPENLFSMWTVFARCADSVAQGRRLENLSWRLWNRETFCCENAGDDTTATSSATTAPKDIQTPKRTSLTDEVPQLSGSVDSLDEEAVEFTTEATPVDILRPRIQRQDSCASSRRRHITSDSLEKMVVSIVESKVPFDAPLPNINASFPPPVAVQQPEKPVAIPQLHPELQRSGSTTTEASPSKSNETASTSSLHQVSPVEMASSHASQCRPTIVRGFTPVPISMSSRILSQASKGPSPSAIPEPKAAPAPKIVQPRKAKFALGGSSGDDSYSDHSLETRPLHPVPQIKKMFHLGGSSGEDSSLQSNMNSASPAKLTAQTNAPSSNHLSPQPYGNTSAVDDDQSETDYVDESAIDDDDDSSDWEDSMEESGKSSMEEINFKRVDSSANLTSRRSIITLMLAQNERVQKHGGSNSVSQSVSHIPRTRSNLNGPSLGPSPSDSDDAALMMMRTARAPAMRPINEIPRSAAQPIISNASGMHHQAALSPRTTRRNMLATELTESLRRHLLWERSQKTSTANAVLKRRHTSHDVANLKQYPERPYMKKDNDVNASSFDPYFSREPFTGYHTQGW